MKKVFVLGLIVIVISTLLLLQTLSAQAQGGTPTPTPTATPKYWVGDPVPVENDLINPNISQSFYYALDDSSDLNAARVGFYIPGTGAKTSNGSALGECNLELTTSIYNFCNYKLGSSDACTFLGLGTGSQSSCNGTTFSDETYEVGVTGNFAQVTYDALVYPIYASSVEPAPEAPACITDTLSAVVGGGVISSTLENGVLLTDLLTETAGSVFKITTADGPWSDGTNAYRYDIAIQISDLDDWVPLGEYLQDLCAFQSGVYVSTIITATATTRFRVNDVTGAFADNTGSMGITIERIYEEESDGSFWFYDGDMELALEAYWLTLTNGGSWGRILNSNLLDSVFYPDPYCNDGLQAVGYADERTIGTYHDAVSNTFYWPGGEMFYRFVVKRAAGIFDLLYDPPDYKVTIRAKYYPFTTITFQDEALNNAWDTVSGSEPLIPPGYYEMTLDLVSNDNPQADTLVFDDVWVSLTEKAACSGEYIAPTPTTTPTPANTPGDFRVYSDDCGFEYAGTQPDGWPWRFDGDAYLRYSFGADTSPLGGYFGHVNNEPGSRIYQNKLISLANGDLFITYYARGTYAFYVQYGTTRRLIDSGDHPEWRMKKIRTTLGDGGYFVNTVTLSFEGNGVNLASWGEIDGISAANYYATCTGVGPTATPSLTPGGPTATPTLIPTAAASATITPFASYTPGPTNTQLPIYKTATAFVLTYTPAAGTATGAAQTATAQWATATDIYLTETAAQATATAQGTPAPATATASATATSFSTATALPTPTETPQPPPQQPPGACSAECIRPAWNEVSEWINYQTCRMERFISWCPYHSATMVAVDQQFNDREPFAMVGDMRILATEVNALTNQYDWENSGVVGSSELPDVSLILTPQVDSPYNGGTIDVFPTGTDFSTSCELRMEDLVGPVLTGSMCWAFNVAYTIGYTQWVSMIMNLSVLLVGFLYVLNVWIKPGMQS